MATTSETLSPDQLAKWRKRVTDLGLDPDIDAINVKILRHTKSLEEYRSWYNFRPHPEPKASDLTAAKVEKLPDALFRRHIVRHLFGENPITDPETVSAVEKRVGRFYAYIQAAPDYVATAAKPLLINSTNSITVYGKVTIKDGGYIKILLPVSFECQVLEKIQGGTGPAPEYDIFIVGENGQTKPKGKSPAQPAQTAKGGNAECDCCGGAVARYAQQGSPGTNGDDGGDAENNGGDGNASPDVSFTVHDSLPVFVSVLNKGGDGARGSDGGRGAQGGKGGNGGDGTTCGAYQPDGAKGGTGGTGGNGGNASNGGNGGAGGVLKLWVPENQVNNINITNLGSKGGEKGIRGLRGDAGPGGDAGGKGGSAGDNGKPGATDGNDGQPGNPANKGTVYLNGQQVQS